MTIAQKLEEEFNLVGKTVKDPDFRISHGLMWHARYVIEEHCRGEDGLRAHAEEELKKLRLQEPVPEHATQTYKDTREIRELLANMTLKHLSPLN